MEVAATLERCSQPESSCYSTTMRYGKVYFYDRMGNREPTESDRVREALESFDAPRFRPPENMTLGKNYTRQFSPMETPPPFNQDAPEPVFDGPTSRYLDRPESNPLGFPPRVPFADVNPPFSDMDRYKMDDVGLDPKFRRLEPPQSLDPLRDVNLEERIGPSIERGIMLGAAERLHEDMEELTVAEERVHLKGENGLELSRFRKEEYYGEQGDICAQCRLEDMYLHRMKSEADAEVRKHEEAARKAVKYEADMTRKEEEARFEEESRRRRLRDHVDSVNQGMIDEHKARRVKSPPQDYYIFRREDVDQGLVDRQRKENYARDLSKQMEEKRLRRVDEYERQEALDAASNSRAAREFAAFREAEETRSRHDKDALRRQLEFQMEMQRKAPPSDDAWLWWAERPDEHGWRAARLQKQSNQVERNEHMRNNIDRLEQFKTRQHERDAEASEGRRAKYAQIRERLHENSELVHGHLKEEDKRRNGISWQVNPQVEAAWKEAHEKNDKKYRTLQDSAAKSISAAAIGETKMISCRRCIRCHRVLGSRVETRGETVAQKLWNAL